MTPEDAALFVRSRRTDICRFFAFWVYYTLDQNAVVAQPVERRTRNAQVKGSSPFNGSVLPAIVLISVE